MILTLPDKPASLSTVYGATMAAGKAVDGIYLPESPLIEYENIASSLLEMNPWWRVDLQDSRCIIAVNVLNRICKCTESIQICELYLKNS